MKKYRSRPALPEDLMAIHNIIRPLSGQGRLQPRTRGDIREHLANFMVVERIEPPKVVASGELRVLSPKRMAEIWSLSVSRRFEGQDLEGPLLQALIQKAQELELEKVFTVSDRIAALEMAGFFVPPTGEKNMLFFYPQVGKIPPVLSRPDLEILSATMGELTAVHQLIKQASREGSVLERSVREIEFIIMQGCSFVALKNGEMAGHACLDIYNADQGELRSLVVLRNYRHQGLAKELITAVCLEAQRRNLSELNTVTNKTKLFLGLGFKFSTKYLTEARWVYPLKETRDKKQGHK